MAINQEITELNSIAWRELSFCNHFVQRPETKQIFVHLAVFHSASFTVKNDQVLRNRGNHRLQQSPDLRGHLRAR